MVNHSHRQGQKTGRHPWLPRGWPLYLPILLTVIAGLAITLVVFAAFQASERDRIHREFETMAADRAQAIRAGLAEDSTELELLASYVRASRELLGNRYGDFALEFGRFVQRIPAQEPDTQAVAFISRVADPDRAAFESSWGRELARGVSISELGPAGEPHPAAKRSLYFPVTVVEPLESSTRMIGFDLGSVPALHAILEKTMADGKVTMSGSTRLPALFEGKPVLWNFIAVYRDAATAPSPAAQGRLLGIAAMAFRIDQMVDLALRDLSPAGLDIELLDPRAPAGQQVLYYRKAKVVGYQATPPIRNWLSWSTTIDAGERTWTMRAFPTRDFMARNGSWLSWVILAGGLLLTAMGSLYLASGLRRTARVESLVAERTRELAQEVAKHKELEEELAESRASLAAQVDQLAARNREVQLLNEAGDMLQSCVSTDEAYPLIRQRIPGLLPATSGALYIRDPQKNLFAVQTDWGDRPPTAAAFSAEDCWALRRGRVYPPSGSALTLPCRHLEHDQEEGSLCIPVAATGKTIGLFHVLRCSQESQAFAISVAEHIGLALSNLILRSDLRQLSIRDPLTGLFNRRYMEETLELEISRAERKEHSIGVIMLDIDHFKGFNDRFGHAAGDELLQALAQLIRSNLRAGDVACRYGGEEFVLILPEATEEVAARRAEDMRGRAREMDVRHLETVVGPVSVSLGVGLYPDHGRTREELLAAADAALYEAKGAGRDRVVVARIAEE
jgi:diguanylate cyclase (GGDEF)-like protein